MHASHRTCVSGDPMGFALMGYKQCQGLGGSLLLL